MFRVIAEACEGLDSQVVISTGHGYHRKCSATFLAVRSSFFLCPAVRGAPSVDSCDNPCRPQHCARRNGDRNSSSGCSHHERTARDRCPYSLDRSGEVIANPQVTPQALRAAVVRVRSNQSYRTAAERVRDAIEVAGGAPCAAELIEQRLALKT